MGPPRNFRFRVGDYSRVRSMSCMEVLLVCVAHWPPRGLIRPLGTLAVDDDAASVAEPPAGLANLPALAGPGRQLANAANAPGRSLGTCWSLRLAARSATTVFIAAVARPGSASLPARTEGFTAVGSGAASANLPVRPVGFITAAAKGSSANFPANPADRGFRLRFLAESARIFWATATGEIPVGAAAAALVAFPANRTNCRYFSNNCRHFSKSGSAAVIPATFACNA